jgi:hypothetical protein
VFSLLGALHGKLKKIPKRLISNWNLISSVEVSSLCKPNIYRYVMDSNAMFHWLLTNGFTVQVRAGAPA